MQSDPNQPGTEAYFRRYMAGKIHGEEEMRVMTSRKFWDFLASEYPTIATREYLADKILRRTLVEDTSDPENDRFNEKLRERVKGFPSRELKLSESDKRFRIVYGDGGEGGWFEFVRTWFCSKSLDEGEDKREAMSMGKKAEKEHGKSEAQDQKASEWTGLVDSEEEEEEEEDDDGSEAMSTGMKAEEENGQSEAQGQKILEWTDSDSEAEHRLDEQEAVRAGDVAPGGNRVSSTEIETVLEWTDYDSQAEREEAERRRR